MNIPGNSYILFDKNGGQYIFRGQLEAAAALMSFMLQVIYGKDIYCKSIARPSSRRVKEVSHFGQHLPQLDKYADLYSRKYSFHPALKFFFEEYRRHEIQRCADLQGGHYNDNGALVGDVFDDFVYVMRKNALKTKLKKQISNWESKFKKNRKRVIKLEKDLFTRRSRLTVIRLDLGYRAATFSIEDLDKFHRDEYFEKRQDIDWYRSGRELSKSKSKSELELEPLEVRVALEEVQLDRERLFSNMKGKPSLFKHLLGYVWRIECTPHAGYHLHLALFFHGDKIKKHEWLAQQIGEYWEHRVTKGRGRFHNCNRAWNKESSKYGIGEIESSDHVKRFNLRNALTYLCKDTQAVLILPHAGGHLFGSGFSYRDRSKGRGRPRTVGEGGTGEPRVPSKKRASEIVIF